MPEETAATLESTMDAELEALFNGNKESPVGGDKPASGEGAPEKAASPSEAPETLTDEDPLLAALDALEEEPKVETPPEGTITTDQKAVLEAIPDIQTATGLYNVVSNYNNFTTALEKGQFDNVEAMLTDWNKDTWEGLKEHIYKKHAVEIVDRWVKEQSDPVNPGLTKLEKEINSLKQQITEKKQGEAKQTEVQRNQETFTAYNKFVDNLFDQIKFSEADRPWVNSALREKLATSPDVLAAIKAGNPKAIVPIFKATIRAYATRDKAVSDQKNEKLELQAKKKIPVGGAGAEAVKDIPDDINQVKPEDRDTWMDRQLAKVFKKK